MKKLLNRVVVSVLALSATGLIGIVSQEGFTPTAVIPTKGDVPTVGFGSTVHQSGTPVRLGDKLTPVQALQTVQAHLQRIEPQFKASLPGVEMTQASYDAWVDFVYQFGIENWKKSSMRRKLLAGDERAACDALLLYKYAGGFDCSTPGNTRCMGVWTRQLERQQKCLEALK